jgi:hypothetical protein
VLSYEEASCCLITSTRGLAGAAHLHAKALCFEEWLCMCMDPMAVWPGQLEGMSCLMCEAYVYHFLKPVMSASLTGFVSCKVPGDQANPQGAQISSEP